MIRTVTFESREVLVLRGLIMAERNQPRLPFTQREIEALVAAEKKLNADPVRHHD